MKFLRERTILQKQIEVGQTRSERTILQNQKAAAINTLTRYKAMIMEKGWSTTGLPHDLDAMLKDAEDMNAQSDDLADWVKDCVRGAFEKHQWAYKTLQDKYKDFSEKYVDQVASLHHLQGQQANESKKLYQCEYWRVDKVSQQYIKAGSDKQIAKYIGMSSVSCLDQLEDYIWARPRNIMACGLCPCPRERKLFSVFGIDLRTASDLRCLSFRPSCFRFGR